MSEALVRTEEATRTYGQGSQAVRAVAGATCEVLAGQHIALVGPSGSGKTTLVHLLAGLDGPSSGTVEWPAIGPREQLRPGPVAVAFQGPSLLPPLTVLENVALPRLLAGDAEDLALEAAHAALVRFEVDDLATKLPEELSGGQSQRVGLARATVGRPAFILADEPTGQQDQATGQHVMDAFLTWAREVGAAVIVATHDLAIARLFPIRWSMEDGQLRAEVTLRSA
ncbi:MAG: ABC transporter ATP-binding protein [Actinomycetota bacterium]|nr:ABC transporter ATP-binding protein [Actinomycetota bacterium]